MSQVQSAKQRAAEMRFVTLVGAFVDLVLTLGKVVLGFVGQSHALIVDGLHSLSDLLSDMVVWYVAGHSGHGPDDEHPYGHGRFETAATLGLSAIMVLIAGGVLWDSASRFFSGGEIWQPGWLALVGAIGSILAKEGLYWYTKFAGHRLNSDLIKANAWHHRSDAISTLVVLAGVVGGMLGYPWLDVVAALIVGLMVAKVGWDLGRDALQELVDVSLDAEKVSRLRDLIRNVDGVRGIHMLRTRRLAHQALADVHVQVAPWISVSEGHMIALAVEQAIMQAMPEVTDITVHIDPEDDVHAPSCKDLPLRSQVLAELGEAWEHKDCANLGERVLLHYLSGRVQIEVHLPAECMDAMASKQLSLDLAAALHHKPWFGGVRLHYR